MRHVWAGWLPNRKMVSNYYHFLPHYYRSWQMLQWFFSSLLFLWRYSHHINEYQKISFILLLLSFHTLTGWEAYYYNVAVYCLRYNTWFPFLSSLNWKDTYTLSTVSILASRKAQCGLLFLWPKCDWFANAWPSGTWYRVLTQYKLW